MDNVTFSFLKFINFTDLSYWTTKRFFVKELTFSKKHPLKLFGYFLEKVSPKTEQIQDKKDYPIIGVRSYGLGAYINRISQGENLKMKKYQLAEENHLIWCKVDTKNGAFGTITGDLRNSYASSNMALAKIDNNKILNEYLQLIFRSKKIQQYMDSFVSGTTNRKYIKMDELFSKIQIPLPTLGEQRQIVKKYNNKIQLAEEQEQKILQLEKDINKYITQKLGIICNDNIVKSNEYNYLTFYNLMDLSRWDLYKNDCNSLVSTKYKFSKLANVVIEKPLYGAGEKGIKKESDIRYIRITDINEDGTLNDDFVSAEKVDSKYLLEDNDFLIARSGNTVGKTFLYKKEIGKCIYAGYLIKFKLDTNKIIPEYLLYYTKSDIYKKWINSNQRANAQPNINSNEFLESPIIIPPITMQKEMVVYINRLKETIVNLQKQAKQNRITAQKEFEKELFE